MLFLTINSFDAALALFASPHINVDGFELRLDRFASIDLKQISELMQRTSKPLLFTLRKDLSFIKQLLELGPAYFDLEHDTPRTFLEKLSSDYPHTKLILSYHNFDETPELEPVWQKMQTPHVYAYKIACKANSSLDSMRMSAFVQKKTQRGERITGICMGKAGELTRVLGPIAGNLFNYTVLNAESAFEGQLSLEALQQIYRLPKLSKSSSIYALIGDPVEASISHLTHNHLFGERPDLDATYVKIPLKPVELAAFLSAAREFPFQGLSITMPHKEAILPLLDELSSDARIIGAVNTVFFRNGRLYGDNTDGRGGLDALEERGSVKGKKIVILGAGGTARALAYEARKRGAIVLLLNRTAERARKAAKELNCAGYGLHELELAFRENYDILINATSVGMLSDQPLLDAKWILPHSLVMDVVSTPQMTPLLKDAEKKDCPLIFGRELFRHQAAYQFALWFENRLSSSFVKEKIQLHLSSS